MSTTICYCCWPAGVICVYLCCWRCMAVAPNLLLFLPLHLLLLLLWQVWRRLWLSTMADANNVTVMPWALRSAKTLPPRATQTLQNSTLHTAQCAKHTHTHIAYTPRGNCNYSRYSARFVKPLGNRSTSIHINAIAQLSTTCLVLEWGIPE